MISIVSLRLLLLVAVCSAVLLSAAGCGGNDDRTGLGVPSKAAPEATTYAGEWPAPNGDLANTRVASSKIDASNVSKLGVAWTAPIAVKGTFGGYASTPVIAGGVAYTQDLDSNVAAYDLSTGKQLWEHKYDSPTVGPNGVTIGYGKIYGATAEVAFALDAKSGEEVWRSKKLVRNANEGIDMAPAVYDRTVYVSTVPGNSQAFYKGNGQGVIWALDADSGDPKWSFATVPEDLWGHAEINSGGGLWHPPAFDTEGRMFVAVANPAPWPGTKEFPWAKSRPGPNLYTNSLLKLDPGSGKLDWHYQTLPHDVYDWDLQLPPVITSDGDRELVLASGKLGFVFAVDPSSGELVWRTSVGDHNGRDGDHVLAAEGRYDELPAFPVTIEPGILGGVETQMAVAGGTVYAPIVNLPTTFKSQVEPVLDFKQGTGAMVALDVKTGAVKWQTTLPQPAYGAATVSNDLVFTTTFDGKLIALSRATGAIVWETQMSAGTNATVAITGDTVLTAASFAAAKGQKTLIIAYRLGATGKLPGGAATGTGGGAAGGSSGGSTGAPDQGGGQSAGGSAGTPTAAQLAAGKTVFSANCGSCHTLADAGTSGSVGPNLDQLKPSAATVAKQVKNGGNGMPSFSGSLSATQITDVAAYVSSVANPKAESSGGGSGP